MAPSREFMVQQAVLNAALHEPDAAKAIPVLGISHFLGLCTSGNYVRCNLVKNAREEFRKLAARYGA